MVDLQLQIYKFLLDVKTSMPKPVPRHENPTTIHKRNVLIIGNAGAGMSAVGNHILGHNSFHNDIHLQSETRKADMKSDTRELEYDGVRYQVTVFVVKNVWLPSHFASSVGDKISRINEAIKFSDGWHLVIFVHKEGQFTKEEKDVYDYVRNNFPPIVHSISLLVITGCEGKDKKRREEIVREYESSPHTKGMMKKGVFSTGLSNLKEFIRPIRDPLAEKADKDVEVLHGIICESSTMIRSDDLQGTIKLNSTPCTLM